MTAVENSSIHHQQPAYRASEELAANMQRVLVDLLDLSLQTKQAHWNIVGPNFRDLHLALDELHAPVLEFSDAVAERMRALYIVPDGRASTISEQSSLPGFPDGEIDTADAISLITARIYAATGTIRDVRDHADEEDPVTADMYHGFIEKLEEMAWMISAENRRVGKSEPRPIVE